MEEARARSVSVKAVGVTRNSLDLSRPCQDEDDLTQYKPALQESHELCFSEAFANKHRHVVQSFDAHALRDKSKYSRAHAAQYPATGRVNVITLEEFRQWMIRARRFSSWAGVGVTGATVHRGDITRYGRHQASAA